MTKEEKGMFKVNVLKDAVASLSSFLERENEALIEHRHDEVKALQEQKRLAGENYKNQMQYVSKNPKVFLGVNQDVRKEMKSMAKNLDFLMKENDKLLKLGMEVNKKVMKSILDAVRKHEQKNSTYSSNGMIGLGRTATPISYNQLL